MIGQCLLHYRIVAKLGEGGMGVVYRATDTHLDRSVAIKLLPADKVADRERKQRFVQEAKAASALCHPNIVVIHDIASDASRDFMVMELVEGEPLDAIIGRKGLKLADALRLAVQVADGLARAHAAGIVHRDIKPSNVMVTPDGLVKILDFGLAKLTEPIPDSGTGPTMTAEPEGRPGTGDGVVLGTAAYMSPEQAEGKPVDARSDIFSFGAVLYEMLTGRRAFARESGLKSLAAVLNEEPVPVSSVNPAIPPELERIVHRCLRKDRQRRWQTMSDLKVALQEIKEDSESGRLRAAAPPAASRLRKLAAPVAVSAALVLAVAAVGVWLASRGEERAAGFDILPVTLDSGLTAGPTLPRDGSLLAYASDRPGSRGMDIWVQRTSGGAPLRLTDDPGNDSFPSFSPDGSQIAFTSDRDGGGIYVMDALAAGGEARRIAAKGVTPVFSPDGRFIAYFHIPASLDRNLLKAYIVSPKGGEPQRILDGFSFGYVLHGAPLVWSPDGQRLLFQGWRVGDPRSPDWWVAPLAGGGAVRTRAVENLGLKTIVQFPVAWSGDYVYFASGTTIEGVNLFRAVIDPTSQQIRGPAEPITTGPGLKYAVSVLRDGRIFLADMTVGMNAWSVAARPDTGTVAGPLERVTRDLMQNFNPSIARDGSRAAFTAFGGAQAGRVEVRVTELRTGRETAVPMQGVSLGQLPALSPDGALLAYRDVIEGKPKSFVTGLGAAPGRELCANCLVLGFFPGNSAALVETGPNELTRFDLRSGARTPVLRTTTEGISDADLSADGRWIAWLAAKTDGSAAIRIAASGAAAGSSSTITIDEGDYYLGSPAWSPNDRWLYYLSEESGKCLLIGQELDSRTKRPVGDTREIALGLEDRRLLLNFPPGIGTIGVARDRIIFEATAMRGNIFVARPRSR